MNEKKRTATAWIEYHMKLIQNVIEGSASLATASFEQRKEAASSLLMMRDKLYGAIQRSNHRDGAGERAAVFEIKGALRSVYPDLSFASRPSTAVAYVKRLIADLEKARLARKRAEEALHQKNIEQFIGECPGPDDLSAAPTWSDALAGMKRGEVWIGDKEGWDHPFQFRWASGLWYRASASAEWMPLSNPFHDLPSLRWHNSGATQ